MTLFDAPEVDPPEEEETTGWMDRPVTPRMVLDAVMGALLLLWIETVIKMFWR